MTITKKLLVLLLALAFAALAGCAKGNGGSGGETASANDIWSKTIKTEKENVPIDSKGWSVYLLGGGKSTLYIGEEPGEFPHIIDTNGVTHQISITTRDGGATREWLRLHAAPNNYYSAEDILALESDGDLLWGSKRIQAYRPRINENYIVNNGSDYALMTANNDFGFVQGLLNAETGELISVAADGENAYYVTSERGGRLVGGGYADGKMKIVLADLETGKITKTFDLSELMAPVVREGATVTSGLAPVFLGDGSAAGGCSTYYKETDDSPRGQRIIEEYVYVIREDGSLESYCLGRVSSSSGIMMLASNDPHYIIAAMSTAVYMIDRANNKVYLLKEKNGKISREEIPEELPKDASKLGFVDYLDDGETLILFNMEGALIMFRPDTMETKILTHVSSDMTFARRFSGDHRGRICFGYPKDFRGAYFVNLLDADTSKPLLP